MVKQAKKSVMGPVISVFVMVLVISILSGLTFLFVAQLKTQVQDTATFTSVTQRNETGAYINSTGYTLGNSTLLGFKSPVIVRLANASEGTIAAANYTLIGNKIYNATANEYSGSYNVTYTYSYISPSDRTAYDAVNDTESAGATVVGYLPLIFLAVIFGAILTLVLRIILPYINLGKQMGEF